MKVNMRITFKLYRPRSQNEILEKRGAPSPRTSVKAQPLHHALPPPTKEKVPGLCRFQCVYTVETSGRRLTMEGQDLWSPRSWGCHCIQPRLCSAGPRHRHHQEHMDAPRLMVTTSRQRGERFTQARGSMVTRWPLVLFHYNRDAGEQALVTREKQEA